MSGPTRRELLHRATGALAAGAGAAAFAKAAGAFVPPPSEVPPGERPPQDRTVEVLHPRGRVPLSFIIDDSTCLVNMGRFCMPQFKAAWPQNPLYRKPWKDWPAEIPDAFVREFGEFCAAQGVRGKFSLVPYPACVGWLDRELPGWTRTDLRESLKLVRELIAPAWDLTPEMITHTHAIDLKTGRPLDPPGPATMENSYPPQKRSVDELAAYVAYALNLLKNCDLPCTGVTTPGGFGNSCRSELSQAIGQALTDVYGVEIPFYFKYIAEAEEATRPRLEHVEPAGSGAGAPKLVVDVPAGTGDWFGNWDGDQIPMGEKYLDQGGAAGRMAELIERGEPAVMFGHWAGLYSNGSKRGFEACKQVITTLNRRFGDRTVWMKASEMARYAAARELTRIEREGRRISLSAPFAAPSFTLLVAGPASGGPAAAGPTLAHGGTRAPLEEVSALRDLTPGKWLRQEAGDVVCFDLPQGASTLVS
jgi:hypothetical protein